MAISFNGGTSGGRRRGRGSTAISDINVTPFVDVMLVLLIIFMITAHVMEFGIEVEVPKVRQVQDTAQDLPVINITRDGNIYLNDRQANINSLPADIQQKFPRAKSVYLRADRQTPWDVAVQVMSELGAARFGVNVVTQPEDTAGKKR
ncbi:MAG TPA: biopolymer transporter ExbD [Bryobacteraceae bacterium]|nr:biopolymer transporter ExbD [Bryobacteraceae bacterium]